MPNRTSYALIGSAALVFFTIGWMHSRFGFYFWGITGFADGNDDAFISYRYALNLAESGILSFNVQDHPFVEGFSNPAHVALIALIIKIFDPANLHTIMSVMGLLAIAIAIFITGVHFLKRGESSIGIGVVFTSVLCPSLWIHGGSGLETGFIFLFQTLMWLACSEYDSSTCNETRKQYVSKLILLTVCLVLYRTDGFTFPIICAVFLLIKGHRRLAGYILLTSGLAYFGVTAARLVYFGEWFPNTVNVKISLDFIDGFKYAFRMLGSISYKNGMIIGLVCILWYGLTTIILIGRCRGNTIFSFAIEALQKLRAAPIEFWLCSGLIAYYFLIGGDIYRERFLVILFPMSTTLALRLLTNAKLPTWIGSSAIIILFAGSFFVDPRLAWTSNKFDTFTEVGFFLRENYPDAVLAVDAAGKIPFYSQLKTIDILGLNNLAIAKGPRLGNIPGHGKFDANYVLGLKPDIISAHAYGSGDLAYGFDRDLYSAAGYRLAWLVWSGGKITDQKPFLNMLESSDQVIEAAILSGYRYGILEKIPNLHQ